MGRAPCCDKTNVKRGPWSPEEDAKLKEHIEKYGTGGNWIALPQKAGLMRCGKSCRLRWLNYLRPNIKHGDFSEEEDMMIFTLYANIGSRWSIIAAQLPGRTDNDIKNYWNTKLKKKAISMGLADPSKKSPFPHQASFPSFLQTPSTTSSLPSASSLSYNFNNNSHYSTPARPLTRFEKASFNNSSPTAVGTIFNTQESFLGPMPMVRGEASCSSSDGSTTNNQIRHGKELNYEYGNDTTTYDFQMYINNDGVDENNVFMLGNDDVGGYTLATDQKPTGMRGDISFDYGIEDIKQLISSDNSCTTFLFDENKADERVMYY